MKNLLFVITALLFCSGFSKPPEKSMAGTFVYQYNGRNVSYIILNEDSTFTQGDLFSNSKAEREDGKWKHIKPDKSKLKRMLRKRSECNNNAEYIILEFREPTSLPEILALRDGRPFDTVKVISNDTIILRFVGSDPPFVRSYNKYK